jgi:hypothetical protein
MQAFLSLLGYAVLRYQLCGGGWMDGWMDGCIMKWVLIAWHEL